MICVSPEKLKSRFGAVIIVHCLATEPMLLLNSPGTYFYVSTFRFVMNTKHYDWEAIREENEKLSCTGEFTSPSPDPDWRYSVAEDSEWFELLRYSKAGISFHRRREMLPRVPDWAWAFSIPNPYKGDGLPF